MGDEPKREGSADFAESLTGVARWYDSHPELTPQIEAILALGLSQPYEYRFSLARLADAMETFTGVEKFGRALLFAIGVTKDPLDPAPSQFSPSPAFTAWLRSLRSRFGSRAAVWLYGDTKPMAAALIGHGHQDEGVALDVRRADGKSLKFLIPYEVVLEFATDVIQQFLDGGGLGKVGADQIEPLKKSADLLAQGVSGTGVK